MIGLKARRVVLLLTAAILTVMLGVFVYQSLQTPQELHAAQAKEKSINNHLSVQGTLHAIQQSNIAPSQPSTVIEVYVSPGDWVHSGDPLVRLQSTDWTSSDLAGLAALVWEQTFTTNLQEGAVLYADLTGTVTDCPSTGDFLYPAQTAVTIADLSAAQVLIEVPELYADGLQLGQTATVTSISDEEYTYNGTLTQISVSVSEKNNLLSQTPERIVPCVLTLAQTDTTLRPGMTMDVRICTDSVSCAVTVPHTAIRQEGESEYICVVSETGVERRQVETGYQLSSDIQVKYGVTAGEWVLTDSTIPEQFPNGFVVVAA